MYPFALADGSIINLAHVRRLFAWVNNEYTLQWSDGTETVLTGADGTAFTAYLTTAKIAIRPIGPRPGS